MKGRHNETKTFFSYFGKAASILKNLKSQYAVSNTQQLVHKLWAEKLQEFKQDLTTLKQDFARPDTPKSKLLQGQKMCQFLAACTDAVCAVLQKCAQLGKTSALELTALCTLAAGVCYCAKWDFTNSSQP